MSWADSAPKADRICDWMRLLPCGSCIIHSINISLRPVHEDNVVRCVFDQAEMRFQKQDSKKKNL
jgi:hypothetical protein